MDRFDPLRVLTVAAAALLCVTPVRSQTPPPASTSPVLTPAPAEKSQTSSAPKRTRAISSEVAAALAAAAPKYTAPAPAPKVEPKPEAELPDLREADKPKNTIVRLPKYIVREPKSPVFTERSISTEKGLKDIAMRRYISDVDRALNLANLPFFSALAERRALAMYAEDERLRNMSDLEDDAKAASKSDAAAGTYIRREAQKTYLRTSDFGWNGGGVK